MSDRVIFLDVDGVVLIQRFTGGVEAAARITGRELTAADEQPYITDDAVRVEVPGINDVATPVHGWFRPAVIDTLRAAHDRGTHIEWLTSWLTRPERLAQLAAVIGLEFVAIPDMLGIELQNEPIHPRYGHLHWKVQRALVDDREVLMVDDQLELSFMRHVSSRIEWIQPSSLTGLTPADLRQITLFSSGNTVSRMSEDATGKVSVSSLMDQSAGQWLVTTESESRYYIDLDLMLFWRVPASPDENYLARPLRRDGGPVEILSIRELTVGRRGSLLIDLRVPNVPFTHRDTTTIVSIERIDFWGHPEQRADLVIPDESA